LVWMNHWSVFKHWQSSMWEKGDGTQDRLEWRVNQVQVTKLDNF
jgi:hypothetical protein